MPRKENTKAKTWERDRRKRMNTYFKTLADLLPPHQEGRKRNKVDILIHASKYIKDLHSRTEELFSAHASEAHKEELARLKKLVTQLLSRTQLLSTLLKEAGISVPAEPALEKISPLKWSNKINLEDMEKFFSKIEERKDSEKKRDKSTDFKVPCKRKPVTSSQSSSKKISEECNNVDKNANNSIENQENRVNCINNKNDDAEGINNITEVGTKETDCRPNETSTDVASSDAVTKTKNTKPNSTVQKVDTQKKVRRKGKRKDNKKAVASCINNSVTNLATNTLILSGGKLMPLVTPMTSLTSNIIVNTQHQPANPIILSNTQQNQMIVMQPLTNRVQNSVVSVCNQAVINTVQKVTLNTVPSIRTKMVVDSQNWASNVKNIIKATKIGGRKGILPKGKEVTKTTMTYKVPIPAVHKEKVDRPKENSSKKDSEVKNKMNKNQSKGAKPQPAVETAEEKVEKEKAVQSDDASSSQKNPLKRKPSDETLINEEPEEKKRKADVNNEEDGKGAQTSTAKISDFAATCKSIENLKHVIEKIGEDISEKAEQHTLVLSEKETTVENSTDNSLPVSTDIVNPKDITDASKTLTILDSESLKCTDKMSQDITESEPLPPVNFTSPPLKSNEVSIPTSSPSNEVDIPEEKSPEKTSDIETSKSTLAVVDEVVNEVDSTRVKEVCNLGTRFDSLLRVTAKETESVDSTTTLENNKIILNLDTNTTTTMKPESNTTVHHTPEVTTSSASLLPAGEESKLSKTTKDELSKSLSYNSENTFVPITNRTEGLHSDLSNDIFASLQVPSSSHNPESISPTAAFLMAFPLVSSLNGKTEVLDEDMKEDFKYHSQTPPMLLQIGTMEPNSFKIKTSSPSRGGIAEKRLKVACEEKKADVIASPSSNSETMIPVVTATKSLPKVVNDETLREPFKIVQTVLAPTLEKSVSGNSFSHTSSIYSHVETSPVTSIITNAVANDNCQLTTSVTSMTTNTETESIIGSQATASKIEVTNCTTEVSNCNTDVRYSGTQDFLPSYSTVVDTNLETLQSNAVFTNSSVAQDTSSIGISRSAAANVSQSLPPHLGDIVTTTNSSSNISLRSLQVEYPVQMKDKDTQSTQQAVYNKNSLDATVPSSHRLDYAGQIDRVLPTSSQSLRQDYSAQQTKDSLPILASQSMSVYDAQSKDAINAVSHNPQQGFNTMQHEIDQNKSLPRKDSISYNAGNNGNGSRGQSYGTKDPISSSTDTHFQRSYSKLSKETDSGNSGIDQDGKLNDVLRSKPHEPQQDHRRDPSFASTKKIDVDPFTQTFAYGVKESIGTQAEQNVLNTSADGMFQGKREESQNYVSYSNKDIKKISTTSTSNPMTSKSLVQNAPILRYSQQQTSFVATSNYEQSTITENHAKSTTTVAHNSSNFSILSWTTFSPVNGNNLVHFEQGSNQNDNTEAKTICENYSYIPLHKENPSFSNVLVSDAYSVNSNVTGIDKSRMKPGIEAQKQPFIDPTKNRNAQSNVPPPVTKQNRIQSQSQAPPASNDYKYNAESKNKAKYGLDSEYIQNEYSSIDQQNQQQQQQHTAKNHQTLPNKQDKAVYPMSGYDTQVNFDLPEVSTQMKYSIETYATSNFKYTDKTQQQNQHKYQPLTQGQVPTIQHSVTENVSYNTDGKHGQQQQQSSKTKTNQQQHAVRAPVNWMMTPEIKHNANIADIILPPIGKELEFCQNNLFAQTPSYNQGTPNQFYNNYDVAAHSFPNLPVLQSDPKRSGEAFYSEEQPFPWSPTKSTVHNVEQSQSVKGIDQHIVPSTLPTLVGDLDLGTNIPEKQNFLFGQMPSRVLSEQSKDPIKEKEGNVNGREFHTVLNTQNVQHSVPGSSFLSVSQLVEHEKAEKSHQQHHQQQHHHHHHHPHQHQQQQQQQQQQARKHQRKTNTSPRGNSKRQMDIRKQTSNEQLHQRHEEQKSSSHGFSDQNYQQQKYQQNNNVHWRSRNCKSNYTAEALIGTNTSVHDTTTHQEKHASIKFASNYPQNKFQSALPTADTVMPINYFSNADDGTGYGQMVNQNFNSYTYSSNANIYPTSNFITSISNTPSSYMMPLHDNTDYMEANAFLLSNVAASSAATSTTTSTSTTSTANVSASSNAKNHQHYGKHQNCDKRYPTTVAKKTKRKGLDGTMQNIEFPLSGINSPLEDYHHSTTFLPPPPPPHANSLYQNHTQSNVYTKAVNGLPPPPPPPVASAQGVPTVATAGFPVNPNMTRGGIVSSNPMTMAHHPSGTSLTNFNLSTIFPEMNDKVTGYKPPNHIAGGLSQSSNQGSAAYAQRSNYPANPLCHLPQVSEATQFGNSVPPPPPPGVIHYKNV